MPRPKKSSALLPHPTSCYSILLQRFMNIQPWQLIAEKWTFCLYYLCLSHALSGNWYSSTSSTLQTSTVAGLFCSVTDIGVALSSFQKCHVTVHCTARSAKYVQLLEPAWPGYTFAIRSSPASLEWWSTSDLWKKSFWIVQNVARRSLALRLNELQNASVAFSTFYIHVY